MRNPDPTFLLRIAQADACAAATEYLKLPTDAETLSAALKFERYVAHPTHGGAAGTYTDDTEMSCANAHVLLDHEPPYSSIMFADAWVREFYRGGRRPGYSRGFQAILEQVNDGASLLKRVQGKSDKNGAAMRAVPFGVLPTVERVLEAATVQARVTHDTPEGRFSARVVALMSHFAFHVDLPFMTMPAFCLTRLLNEDQQFAFVFRDRWPDWPVKKYEDMTVAVATVQAVITLLTTQPSLMAMLETAMRWGGDTDSVAAIAWGIASPRFRNEHLPKFLSRDLEEGRAKTGVAYLLMLGHQLMAKFGGRS